MENNNFALNKILEKEKLREKPLFRVFRIVIVLLGALFVYIVNKVNYEKHEDLLTGIGCLLVFTSIIFGIIYLVKQEPKGATKKRWWAALSLPIFYIVFGLIFLVLFIFLEPILSDILFKYKIY